MVRTDVEDFLSKWYGTDGKIFKYVRFGPLEYVCIVRGMWGEEYKCDLDKSTTDVGTFNKEDFIKKLTNEELIYVEDSQHLRDGHYHKTGGCTCGAWAIPWMEGHHYPMCKKPIYKR